MLCQTNNRYLVNEEGLIPGDVYNAYPFVSYCMHILPAVAWPVIALIQVLDEDLRMNDMNEFARAYLKYPLK